MAALVHFGVRPDLPSDIQHQLVLTGLQRKSTLRVDASSNGSDARFAVAGRRQLAGFFIHLPRSSRSLDLVERVRGVYSTQTIFSPGGDNIKSSGTCGVGIAIAGKAYKCGDPTR